ncbi:MAG TPA: DUF5985 family protein [Candidatus Acidoferrales bacterium]|nr:DUF5985 family protein [Candidatus Acidoferrales bacterium]
MGPAVYVLGILITSSCGVLLLRGYVRAKKRLLLWSSLCFFGLALSNVLLFIDLVMLPSVDLYLWRLSAAAIAMMFLMYGLIWEGE